MQNLEIISTSVTVQAKEIINDNTVNYVWNYQEGKLPQAINFNLQRGEKESENFTGNNVLTGAYYPETGKFDVQNNNFQDCDFAIYQKILDSCKEIVDNIHEE